MKLESLNNEKFKLNKNEMGSLVGGESVSTGTSAGSLTPRQSGFPWSYSYSADCATTTTTNGTSSTSTVFYNADSDSCIKQGYECNPCDLAKADSITRPF